MAVQNFTKTGNKATTAVKLNKTVFEANTDNHELLKAAYVGYLANGRENLAKTKLRGEVRGGGRKPWKQKGTGRARFGSSRNPIWRGGGIVFGPTGSENYSHKLNTSTKRAALRQALSLAVSEGRLVVIESFENKEIKVKATIALLNKINATGTVLLVVENKDAVVERSTANLPNVKAVQAKYTNVYDLINADHIVVTQKAIELITEWLGESAKAGK